MNIVGIIGALLLALVLTAVFSGSYRHRGPMNGLAIFFLIIFLAAWSGQLWIPPVGPNAFGVAWLPFTSVAFLIAILLVAAASSTGRNAPAPTEKVTPEEAAPILAIGLFFWLLLLFLLASIILGYFIVPGGRILAN